VPRWTAAVLVAVGVLALGTACGGASPRRRPAGPPRVFAFLSHLPGGSELDRLVHVAPCLSVLAPNWVTADLASGTLSTPGNSPRVLALVHAAHVPVWPVINATAGAGGLVGPAERRKLSEAIVAAAARAVWDGVTLDFEALPAGSRGALVAFVSRLATALHAQGRKLAVYTPRPYAGDRAYDRRDLARHADLVLISGYNEHSQLTEPGPVATRAGFARSLAAAAALPPARAGVVLGAFGYDWPSHRPGVLIPATQVPASGERGKRQSGGHILYGETGALLRTRAAAARAAGVRWTALFSLGREPAGVWDGWRTARGVCNAR
jgi:hypothetical protein